MGTHLQKRLAKNIISNIRAKKPLNKQELVVSSGYKPDNADAHAHAYIEAKGVKKELKNLGFSEEGAKKVVEEILYDDKVNSDTRLKAADQVFKIHGTYAPEKRISASVNINELQEQILKEIELFSQPLPKRSIITLDERKEGSDT